MTKNGKRTKVAIIGGGCAGVTAAFELTRPEHANRYDVTIYQQGWRLGGKGASGRGVNGRIEEHGLHLWLGFYENSFRLMRECYEELGRDPQKVPIATWQDAFTPESFVGIADLDRRGQWQKWTTFFPPAEGLPGDPLIDSNPFSLDHYLTRTFELVENLLLDLQRHRGDALQEEDGIAADVEFDGVARPPTLSAAERLVNYGIVFTVAGLLEITKVLQLLLPSFNHYPSERVIRIITAMAAASRQIFEKVIDDDEELRCRWQILDLVFAIIVGFIRHRLVLDDRGLDAIDDYECREWLMQNGASENSVNSAFVRGLYDLALAYDRGDSSKPRLAAGQAVRGALRMFFTYRGQLFWRMSAGMGDTVFAPFYEVLKKRGVNFAFFHRLTHLSCAQDDDGQYFVDAMTVDVQAEALPGREYAPLVDVDGLPSWPSDPDYKQLKNGAALEKNGCDFESYWDKTATRKKQLRISEDFDFAVLAIGGGAVPFVSSQLAEVSPKWKVMLDNLNTVASQALQLWLAPEMDEFGWTEPPITLSAFAKPFDTWADMRHVVEFESWPARPASVAYFCGVLPDPDTGVDYDDADYPSRRYREVRSNAIKFLDNNIQSLWPNACENGSFRWDTLVSGTFECDSDAPVDHPIDTQFWTANVNPTDRYVLALPGTIKFRVSPLDMTFDNLAVAGDWTACGFNEGCVEAAVMSGRLAAHALCGKPQLTDIIGYDHP